MSNVLHMLSIARKAGKLEVGEEPAGAAARAHQAKLLIVARDAADNTYRRVRHFADQGNTTWVSVPYTKVELGAAIGHSACALIAVMDMGIAAALVRGLAQEDPEKFSLTMEQMNAKAEKALRRQREKRQHEKNVKTGKYQHKQAAKAAQEAKRLQEEKAQAKGGQPSQGQRPNHGPQGGKYAHKTSANRKYRKKSGRSNPYEIWGDAPKQKSRPQRGKASNAASPRKYRGT